MHLDLGIFQGAATVMFLGHIFPSQRIVQRRNLISGGWKLRSPEASTSFPKAQRHGATFFLFTKFCVQCAGRMRTARQTRAGRLDLPGSFGDALGWGSNWEGQQGHKRILYNNCWIQNDKSSSSMISRNDWIQLQIDWYKLEPQKRRLAPHSAIADLGSRCPPFKQILARIRNGLLTMFPGTRHGLTRLCKSLKELAISRAR